MPMRDRRDRENWPDIITVWGSDNIGARFQNSRTTEIATTIRELPKFLKPGTNPFWRLKQFVRRIVIEFRPFADYIQSIGGPICRICESLRTSFR
jgi:hypothetical protein